MIKIDDVYDNVIYRAIDLITDAIEEDNYLPVAKKLKMRTALFNAIKHYNEPLINRIDEASQYKKALGKVWTWVAHIYDLVDEDTDGTNKKEALEQLASMQAYVKLD